MTLHWSDRHQKVVQGINIVCLLWTDADKTIPVDFRIYDCPHDGLTKNDHFVDMVDFAYQEGFQPSCVFFDVLYSSVKNLKKIGSVQWRWVTQFKENRQINPDNTNNVQISTVNIPSGGLKTHLRQYGFIKIFIYQKEGEDSEYWATNDENMAESEFLQIKNTAEKSENVLGESNNYLKIIEIGRRHEDQK